MTTLHDPSIASTSLLEHQILHHVKEALRVTLDWNAPVVSLPRKLSSLQFTIKSFRRHLERVMSIEEEGGYLEEVAAAKPNLHSRIESLSRDHARFRARIREIVPQLDALSEWQEEQFGSVCDEIRCLLDDVDRHDVMEIDLLQESMLIDEGGEG
ncbi:MAG: hemerythrin domain-containing protein [Pirellulales bacterium]